MPHKITIPRLGWSMEEGVFAQWLKSAGEYVQAGELIFVLEGEKASQEIESVDSGHLCIPDDAPRPGSTVKVGEIIGFLLADGEAVPSSVHSLDRPSFAGQAHSGQAHTGQTHTGQTQLSGPANMASSAIASRVIKATTPTDSQAVTQATFQRAAGPAARRLARQLGIDLSSVATPDPTGRVQCGDIQQAAALHRRHAIAGKSWGAKVATPRARRRARELGIDWALLDGTGRNGRIRERDVLASQAVHGENISRISEEIPPIEPGVYQPASKLRLAIAQRLAAVMNQAVPVTLTTKVDAQALVAFREQQRIESSSGLIPSYHDMLIYLTAKTLGELPQLNACWHRQGIHAYEDINIAMAVDTPNGLVAPVLRQADRLSLLQIAENSRQLIAIAQAGRLSQSQLVGATFTITNLGMFGIDAFTPILNLPQAAILGVGRIVDEPVVRDGQLAAGKTITLSLTFDHRVLDGAPAARWLQRLSEKLATCPVV